ncbi:glycosyltransferase, partial [Pelagibacteraceae bacterium]|nr:glycosyltransferase [Pelagibacteraceae bacterium]
HIKYLLPYYDITLISNFEKNKKFDKIFKEVNILDLNIKRRYSILSDFFNLIFLIFHFIKNNYILTLSCTPKAGFLCSVSSFIAGNKIRVHFFTGQVWATKRGIEKTFLKFLDKIISFLSTDLLTDSFSQKEILIKNKITNNKKIQVLGNGSIAGVNFKIFNSNNIIKKKIRDNYNIPLDSTVILFLGRLNKDKGILDLIKAYENLIKKNSLKNLYLFIVGPDEIEINKYINSHINYFIRLENYTSRPKDFMCASDIFCLPSYREGFGMSAIEAGACNLPVVCSRIYGLTDSVKENITGLMHEPGNIKQIEACLTKLISNPDLRNKMGKFARQRGIKYFNQEYVTQQLYFFIKFKINNLMKKS